MVTKKKKLYRVTLDWETDDAGDYSTKVWATSHDEAIEMAAGEMVAESSESRTKRERLALQQEYIDGAGAYAAEEVYPMLINDIHDLLAGPKGVLSLNAARAQSVIEDLLQIYAGDA